MRRALVVCALVIAACEAVVGADFDEKALRGATSGGAPGELGAPCGDASECASGHCSDGLCCDAACSGLCDRCDVAPGSCTPSSAGTECGDNGICDGTGVCATGTHRYSGVYGGSGKDEATACAFDADGGLIVAGMFSNTIDFGGGMLVNPGLAPVALFVTRFLPDGRVDWSSSFAVDRCAAVTNGWDGVDLTDLAVDVDGSVIVGGTHCGKILTPTVLDSGEGFAGFVMRLAPGGSFDWSADVPWPATVSRFGFDEDMPPGTRETSLVHHVAVGPGGRVALVGTKLDGGAAPAETYVDLRDAEGNAVWQHAAESDGTGAVYVRGAVFGSDGRLVITGALAYGTVSFDGEVLVPYDAAALDQDVFLVRFDTRGNAEWSMTAGDLASQMPESLAIDRSDRLVLAGSFAGGLGFGGPTLVGPSNQTGDQRFIDAFTTRLSFEGSHDTGAAHGPFFGDGWLGIQTAVDGADHRVLMGRLNGQSVELGGATTAATNPDGGWFLFKQSADGTPLWVKTFDVARAGALPPYYWRQWLWNVAAAPGGAVAICGHLTDPVDYGGGVLASAGERDVAIAVFEP